MVELSIVLVILMGMVIKGRQLIFFAKLRKDVANMRNIAILYGTEIAAGNEVAKITMQGYSYYVLEGATMFNNNNYSSIVVPEIKFIPAFGGELIVTDTNGVHTSSPFWGKAINNFKLATNDSFILWSK